MMTVIIIYILLLTFFIIGPPIIIRAYAKKHKLIVYNKNSGRITRDYSDSNPNEDGTVTGYRNIYEERRMWRNSDNGASRNYHDDYEVYDYEEDYGTQGFFSDDDSSSDDDAWSFESDYEPVTDMTDPQCLDDSEPWEWD